jgi:hypothetical protein
MYVRTTILAILLAYAVPADAQASMWCYRADKSSPATCVFPSADQCLRGALIMGGLCERADRTAPGPAKPGPRRSGKAKSQG